MFSVNKTSRGFMFVIALVSIFSGVFTCAFLTTGLDIPAIIIACILAVWIGTRRPRATLKQLYWGWGTGGVAAFVIAMFSPLIGFFFSSKTAEVAVIAFWTLLAMPSVGAICAVRGRQWRDERNTQVGLGLLLFIILVAVSPLLVVFIQEMFT